MRVTINGKVEEVQATTMADLLSAKGIESRMVTIEQNGQMVAKDQMVSAAIREGDQIEILFFMGGGWIPTFPI